MHLITSGQLPTDAGPQPFKLYRTPAGKWIGVVVMRTPAGPVKLAASCEEAVLRAALEGSLAAALMRVRAQIAANPAAAGSIFGKVWRGIKKVGRGVGQTVSNLAQLRIKRALQSAVRTATSAVPGGAQALRLASQAAPALAFLPGGAAVAAAARVMRAAQQGSPRARLGVRRITAAARQGNPQAQQLAAALMQAVRLLQQAAPATAGHWQQLPNGQEVYVPAAQASGPGLDYLWDQLRPRFGYRRDTADVLTRRKAYRRGIEALASRALS